MLKEFLKAVLLALCLFVLTLFVLHALMPSMATAELCDPQEYRCHYHTQGFNDKQIAKMEQLAAREYEQLKEQQ